MDISRRNFIKNITVAGIALNTLPVINVLAQKSAGKRFKVALIGCGGRGKGALKDCIEAAKSIGAEIELVAVADFFRSRAQEVAKSHGVPDERCFDGATGYQKAIATAAEIVITATPPSFRPVHVAAAIQAGKHVFMEKPVAVDPPGARSIIATGEVAKKKGLALVAGTQRRSDSNYRRTQYAVANGAIGDIVGGNIMWCGGSLWHKTRDAGEADASYMVRNWTSFAEMSGDHIVEQHVHNIDIANWFIGRPPVSAIGFGGRAQRVTGDQFDFFSVDLDYGKGCHIHSMCRQVDGTYGRVGEFFIGTNGQTSGNGGLKAGKNVTTPEFAGHSNPYVQEHIDLLQGILKSQPRNDARPVAEATMVAIMARISTYTGQLVRWVDVMENKDSNWYNFTMNPSAGDFEKGTVVAPEDDVIPVPGQEKKEHAKNRSNARRGDNTRNK